jgi:aminopeptidase C
LEKAGIFSLIYRSSLLPSPPSGTSRDPTNWGTVPDGVLMANGNVPLLEQVIVSELDKGKPVWIAINWKGQFVDKKTGVMSLAAFHTPFEDFKFDRNYEDTYRERAGHAVVITGYDMGPDGKVTKFKVHNSWGAKPGESGDSGVFHMYRDYFENFISHVDIIMTLEQLEAIKTSKSPEEFLAKLRGF